MSLFASRPVWTEPGTVALCHSPLPTSRNVQPLSSVTRACALARALVCASALTEAKDAKRREAQSALAALARRADESLDMKAAQALNIFVKARDKFSFEVIKIPGTS